VSSWQFKNLGSGRVTDALSVKQVASLLSLLATKPDGGLAVATDVLGCFYPTPRKGKISRKQLILSAVALPPCLENFPGAAVPDKAACLALRARQGTRISHRLIPLTGSSPLTLKAKGKLPRKTGLNRAVQIQRKPALNLTISASYESFYPFVQTHL